MTTVTFDALGYFEKLKAAGVPEEQARIQADIMRIQSENQNAALNAAIATYDDASRKELATKLDLRETKHEILKWMMTALIAQTALIIAVIGMVAAFLK